MFFIISIIVFFQKGSCITTEGGCSGKAMEFAFTWMALNLVLPQPPRVT